MRNVPCNNDFARLMVTLKMEVVYKQNTPTHTKLKAIGRVLRDGGSRAQVEGEIVLPDGTVCATCKRILFKIPQAVQARFGTESEEWTRTTPQVPEGCNCGPEGHVCAEKTK